MTHDDIPETVIRRFTEHGCEVTVIVSDPADAQETLYGTVTRDGTLIGSYYCTDRVRQSSWHIVTALGVPLAVDGQPVNPVSEGATIVVLTTILAALDSHEIEHQLRNATRSPLEPHL